MVELKFNNEVKIPKEVPFHRLLKREVSVGQVTIDGEQFVVFKSKLNFGTLVFTREQWKKLLDFISFNNKSSQIPKNSNSFSDFLEIQLCPL